MKIPDIQPIHVWLLIGIMACIGGTIYCVNIYWLPEDSPVWPAFVERCAGLWGQLGRWFE